MENKLDRLIQATDRSTMDEIFGSQSTLITQRIDEADGHRRGEFEVLKQDYERGALALDEVREKMLTLLGGNDREVSTPSGIYVRDLKGEKTGTVSNGTKIKDCRRLLDQELPETITRQSALRRFAWGEGVLEGERVIFPWELTISSFTREIVEATARRTAEEFIRMGGEKNWTRPIYIELSTEDAETIRLKTRNLDGELNIVHPEAELERIQPDDPQSR